eukprot:272028-Amphidinium_carterae.2
MEHHSNIVPWQLLAQRTGATLRFAGALMRIAYTYDMSYVPSELQHTRNEKQNVREWHLFESGVEVVSSGLSRAGWFT